MSDLIAIPAALVASPRPCAPVAGARPFADDAQPRLDRLTMPAAHAAWRLTTAAEKRGSETVATQGTQDGRTAFAGGTYVITNKQHSTRSGPSTSRPPA